MVTHIGVVASHHEDSIVEPWLLAGSLKELPYCHICIANTFMHDDALFRIDVLVFLWNLVGMVRGSCEDCSHKRLLHL